MGRRVSPLERLIRERALEQPDEVWLKWADEEYSWRETLSIVQRTANGLLEAGIRPGDRVAIMAANRPEFLFTYFGAALIGAPSVPVNTSQRGPTLEHILADSGASVVIFDGVLAEVVLAAKARCSNLRRTVALDGRIGSGIDVTFDRLLMAADREPQVESDEDVAGVAIMYTSGTVGPPKGVVTERRDPDQSAFLAILQSLDVKPGETMYTSLPLFHGNALYVSAVGSILLNAKLALAAKFSASRTWSDCARFDAVTFATLGGMIPILLKQSPSDADRAHRVRRVLDAGCPADLWRPFEERFGTRLVEWYGLVDAPGYLLNNGGPVGSMGRPVGTVQFRVVDEADLTTAPGTIGELVFRQPAGKATRYHNKPDETNDANRGGWFHTGDLATQDPDGWFYFRGRKKASIRRLGENISAWEIETVLNSHPLIIESGAFAVQSELGEDEVAVAIVAKPDSGLTAEQVIEHCADKMARHAIPRYVFFVNELPKTATQRVQYAILRDRGLPTNSWDRVKATGVK